MIFVTVGSGSFDELIKEIDSISKEMGGKIICQIGNGKFIPKNCKWFRFTNEFESYLKKAKLIISHGGAGTIFKVISMKKKLIGVSNPKVLRNHQKDLLEPLEKKEVLIWCRNIKKIKEIIKKIDKVKIKKYIIPKCGIDKEIKKYLKKEFKQEI